jgi:hypothetical protein
VDTIRDFEDLLALFHRHRVQYLIIGGLAFIYHAKPRFTKDIDLWIEPSRQNLDRANRALSEFGSPILLNPCKLDEIVQIGLPPSRIDLLLKVTGLRFPSAWRQRVRGRYGRATAQWIGLDSLIRAKQRIAHPRHQEDVRVLREVKRLRQLAKQQRHRKRC